MKRFLTVALLGLLFVGCSSDDSNDDAQMIGDCNPPTQFSEFNITQTSAVVSWQQTGAPSFIVEYGEQGFSLGSGSQVTATNLEASIMGLDLNTTYDYYVRAVCAINNVSVFIGPENFTTLNCNKVTGVNVFNITKTTASVSFDISAIGTEMFEVEYGESGFPPGIGQGTIINTSTPVDITGLAPSTTHDVYVRRICGTQNGEYSDVETFTTLAACAAPAEIDGVPLGSGSVAVGWDPTGETAWRVEYGLAGFALGTGQEINTSNSSIQITGLQSGEVYDFYVQANCGAEGFSEFTGPLTLAVD